MTQNEMRRAAAILSDWADMIYESNTSEDGVFTDEQPQADYDEARALADKLLLYAVA